MNCMFLFFPCLKLGISFVCVLLVEGLINIKDFPSQSTVDALLSTPVKSCSADFFKR